MDEAKAVNEAIQMLTVLRPGSLVRIPNAGTTATVLRTKESLGVVDEILHHRVLVSWWDGCHRYEDWLSVVELEVIQ